ncbi:hypothetical protein [Sphingobacterium sp. SYP-B4668]|uniref:hypothetical protein n=1 Tax=Sphingobacterium sp. SYP-B4668 TaxID=2996035 RepID=UPI0022DDC22B|nr:hypothetical protein [Sphingobacterium sp. SYP-B4668]
MHLREIVKIAKQALPSLIFKSDYISGAGEIQYKISNLTELRKGLLIIEEIPLFKATVENVRNSTSLFKNYSDFETFNAIDNHLIEKSVSYLRTASEAYIHLYSSFSISSEDEIKIRLPDFESFDELSKISNDLKKALSIPISDSNTNGSIKIQSAEPGSVWLIVLAGTVGAVKLVGAICWSAAVIRKKQLENKLIEANLKTLDLKNDALESVVNAQKTQLQNVLNAEAEAIANNYYDLKDPETINRLKLSISTTSELIDKGAKFIPESKSEDVIAKFPDFSNLNMIESSIRQLKEGA